MTNEYSAYVAQSINPALIGLFGFAFTTIVLSLCNIGIFEMNSVIIALTFLFGGAAQFLAGVLEWHGRQHLWYGGVFTSFGMFWLVYALAAVLPLDGIN